MITVRDVLDTLEQLAPERFAFDFDSVGLQLGDPQAQISRAVVALDRSLGAVEFAANNHAQLLLSHHPLFFNPMERLNFQGHRERTAVDLIRHGIACIAAHTNWDAAIGGVNDALAAKLGVTDVESFGYGEKVATLKLVVTVPAGQERAIIEAASGAGAGVIGNYTECAFASAGEGTFRPGPGAQPAIGRVGDREQVHEVRLEMTCLIAHRGAVDHAVRAAHPYEEPAIDWYVLNDRVEQPCGRVGSIQPMSLQDFSAHTSKVLGTQAWTWGDPERIIRRVAMVGGGADGDWVSALRAGADLYLTGEVRQHVALEASESGIAIMAAGHYATEQPGVEALARALQRAMPDVEWTVFAPNPGLHGRPF